MSNYFDNNAGKFKWEIGSTDGIVTSVKVRVDHGDHTHTLDLTKAKLGDLVDAPNRVFGDAHRATSHDKKEDYDTEDDI